MPVATWKWLMKIFRMYYEIVLYTFITQYVFERSRRDFSFDQPRVKLVPWPRQMHQESWFDQ